jgi:hypothetical protein
MENNNHQSHQILHSYCLNPDIRFETQADQEKVLLVVRAHPITQLHWVINALFFLILLIVSNFITSSFLNIQQVLFINIFGIVIILSYVWFNFLNWFFNVGIITNKQIIDIDLYSVLYKEVTEARLNKVQDITSKIGGYFESFFDYGNVFIQTAGTEENIEFFNIPHPSEVVQIIDELIGK